MSAAPGLDSRDQTSANSGEAFPAPEQCLNPDPRVMFVHRETGETRPAGCRRLRCPGCLPTLAWRRGLAIAEACPTHAVTLTGLADPDDPEPWPQIRKGLNRYGEYYVRMGGPKIERVAHAEPNPKGTGFHAHLWVRSPGPIDFGISDAAARRAGLGWVHVERIRSKSGAGAYGLKGLGYGLKGVAAASSAATYLHINGGRLTHQSRGFFGPGGVRAAEKRALAKRGESPWILIST